MTEETGTRALRQLGTFDTSGWNAQLNFTVPFGRDWTSRRVAYARALLQLDQTQANSRPPSCCVG